MLGFPVDAVALRGVVRWRNARRALEKFVADGLKPGCQFAVGLCARTPEISLRPLSKIALIHHVSIPCNQELSMKPNRDATSRLFGGGPEADAQSRERCMVGALVYQCSLCEQAENGILPSAVTLLYRPPRRVRWRPHSFLASQVPFIA